MKVSQLIALIESGGWRLVSLAPYIGRAASLDPRHLQMYIPDVQFDLAAMTKPKHPPVNVAELRQNLPRYLAVAHGGGEIEVTSRGRLIARIVPGGDRQQEARSRLAAARKRCKVGDVVSPLGVKWSAEQ
jgi:prevent-host-death family protein